MAVDGGKVKRCKGAYSGDIGIENPTTSSRLFHVAKGRTQGTKNAGRMGTDQA